MSQLLVDFYAIANICLLIWYLYRYGFRMTPGLIVLSFYVAVAVMAVPAYSYLQEDWFFSKYDFTNVTLFPYIYLFVTTLLFLYPIFNFQKYVDRISFSLSEVKVKRFIVIYTLCALFSIYCYYQTIVSNVSLETLSEIRQSHYEGDTLKAYDNIIEQVIMLFVFNFNPLAAVVFFYALAFFRKKLSRFWIWGMGIGVFGPPFMVAIMTSSRGMLINELFLLLVCYCLFSSFYPRRLKRILAFLTVAVLVIFSLYSALVTESRFGKGSDAVSSIICYFGQPTIIFNSQTMDISSYANGNRFFYPVIEYFGGDPGSVVSKIVKGWSPCFDTFIGDLYVDFGPILTLLIALVVPYMIDSYFRRKKILTLPRMYLMVYYCTTMIHGALVTGKGFIFNILFCVVIYYSSAYMLGKTNKLTIKKL